MRRVIGVGSALALLVFAAALVVMLTPPPCETAAAGRFHLCIPVNLTRGVLLALLAAALSALIALVGVYHSLISGRHVYAALMGSGVLAVAFTFALTPLVKGSALLAIILAPLLAIVTLLYGGTPSRRGSAHSGR